MKFLREYFANYASAATQGWNRFWFTPTDPATYSLIRLLAGLMLLYTHAVWTLEFDAFFAAKSPWLSADVAGKYEVGPFAWSHFYWIQSPSLLWGIHIAALVVLAMFALGLFSRFTSILAFLITVSYANRVPGALFGLDQINGFLALYLMVGPCGAYYSLDRWIARRRAGKELGEAPPSYGANIGIRLIQLQMCVVYLFAGLGKLKGDAWWDGTAMWMSIANYEYQSIDMTWMATWPLTLNVMTHVAVWWEATYCFLIWPRWSRPIVLALAIPLHLGIAGFLGMITFGLVMLIANLAFVPPQLVRAVLDWPFRRWRAEDTAAPISEAAPARKKAKERLGA